MERIVFTDVNDVTITVADSTVIAYNFLSLALDTADGFFWPLRETHYVNGVIFSERRIDTDDYVWMDKLGWVKTH